MTSWRVQRIETKPERILNHYGYYSLENRTIDLQARIIIDLDQPRLEIFVNHKIQSEYLKIVLVP